MLSVLLAWLAIPVNQQEVSYGYKELLHDYLDLDRLTVPPAPGVRALQFSSYDRASAAGPGQPEQWFAGGDRGHYLRVEEGAEGPEYVLAEVAGPALVTRIWSDNPGGVLRFYTGGAAAPALVVPFAELCGGAAAPFGAPLCGQRGGGWNCYLPLPFGQGLKLTASQPGLAYQVSVRTYPEGTGLPTASRELLAENQGDIDFVNQLLERHEFLSVNRELTMTAGRVPRHQFLQVHVGQNGGKGTVRSVEVRFLNPGEVKDWVDVLRSLRFQVLADATRTPQVDVPLGDFFGAAPGLQLYDGYLLQVEEGAEGLSFYSNFPMPYSNSLKIRLFNEGLEKPQVKLFVTFERNEPNPLRFHAAWRQTKGLETRPYRDLRVLETSGPGRLVGCTLVVGNPAQAWWGDGDEKLYVDGESFPSSFGTGTADYFGYSRGGHQPFASPFHSLVRCDRPDGYGYTCATRVHLADWVPFQKSLVFDLEIQHAEDAILEVASTAYWYAPLDATHPGPPLPDPHLRLPAELPEPGAPAGGGEER